MAALIFQTAFIFLTVDFILLPFPYF